MTYMGLLNMRYLLLKDSNKKLNVFIYTKGDSADNLSSFKKLLSTDFTQLQENQAI